MSINYDRLSKQILDLDYQIRFAGVVNNKGVIIAGGQKENIIPTWLIKLDMKYHPYLNIVE